jgi:hypothetical protein
MTQSLVTCHESPNLAASISQQDQAHATFFTTLPELFVDRANLPTTAKQLAKHLLTEGSLFERGAQVVRIVQGADGARNEQLTCMASSWRLTKCVGRWPIGANSRAEDRRGGWRDTRWTCG